MTTFKWRTLALSVVMTLSAAGPAVAADPTDADTDVPEATQALDQRLLDYWGTEMREVAVLQKRLYRKEDRHEFSLYTGVIPNDDFYSYYPIGARWDFYFAEDFGTEVWGSYLIRTASGLESFLEANFNNSLLVDVPQSLQWLAGANFLWSPIHGKIGFFTDKLAHFDVHLAFGVGAIGTTVREPGGEKGKVDISGNIGLGMRFYLSEDISVRFDYRQFFYPAEGGGLSHPAELTLAFSFWTAAPE